MDTYTFKLLQKVLLRIIEEPESLVGAGLTRTEAAEIRQTGKIRFVVLASMAAMHNFDWNNELYGITRKEGGWLRAHLERWYQYGMDPDVPKYFSDRINFDKD